VLYVDGEAVTGLPYLERRVMLEDLKLTGAAWRTALSIAALLTD
jgi:ATP-dependent DNA ligase